MIEIDIHDETGELDLAHIETIRGVLKTAADEENIEGETEVSVTFVEDERIRKLNRMYRNQDRSTDVLSFALQEEGEGETRIVGDEFPNTLGDIVISVQKAKEQSERFNHSFMRELGFLAVHGFLHLCGYDHMTQEDESDMFSRQKELLERYGLTR